MGKRGFTLLEIMVAVVIVGIIAAIAIPSYTGYVTRTKRADAVTALQTVALFQEKNMAEIGRYDTIANLVANVGLINPNADANRNYDITVNLGAGNTTFTAIATPNAGNFSDTIAFAIQSDGQVGRWNGAFVADPDLWRTLKP